MTEDLKTTILFIEDNPDHAELVRRAFKRSRDEYSLISADSGSSATAFIDANTPALILCDFRLPDCTGLELLKHVVKERCPSTPFVLLTSQGDETIAVDAMKSGATDYIVKSETSMASLPDVCRAILREYGQKRERDAARDEFERFFSVLPDLACIASTDGYFIKLNYAWEETLGYTIEELLATRFLDLIHPEDIEHTKVEIKRQLSGESTLNFTNRYRCKNGLYRELEWKSTPANATSLLLYATARDITDRRQAEKALFAAEAKFRNLLESIELAAVMLDDNGVITFCNDYLLNLADRQRHEVIGGNWFDLFVPKENRDEARSQFLARINGANTSLHFEGALATREGRLRQVVWDTALLHDNEGGVIGTAQIGTDVTEHRQLEEQLRHTQKIEAIGTLASGIAHDFNNILTVIMGYASMIKVMAHGNQQLTSLVDEIDSSVERATEMTKSLLAISRKQAMDLQPTDINQVIRGLQKSLRRLIREDIEFTVQPNGVNLTAMIDKGQIEQVIINLTVNARDAMPTGGKLAITTDAVELDGREIGPNQVETPGRYGIISVTDSGVGMDRQTREQIFEPFFTTKEAGKGTGLGLSIVYGIVKKHNGFIDISSELGQGATFRIYLPLMNTPPQESSEKSKEPLPCGNETILLVEDEAAVRDTVRMLLERFGYRVLIATNGMEGVAVFRANRDSIHLLITDVIMPKLNGREVHEEIRKIRAGVPTIFMSGYTAEIIAPGGLPDGAATYLPKPIAPEVLLKAVRKALDGGIV